jgi:ComEC/Rec2-related protein
LPALKLLCGILLGILLQSLIQSYFETFFIPAMAILCAIAGIVVVFFLHHLAPSIHAAVYWGASICAGLVMGAEARESSSFYAQHQYSRAIQPEMRAVIVGDVLRVMRRDSTPTAHILHVLVSGSVDAEPLPRLAEQRVLCTLIFPATSSATIRTSLSHEQIHAGSRIYACVQARLPQAALLPTDRDEQQYAASLGAEWIAVARVSQEASNCALLGANITFQTNIESTQEWLEQRVNALFPATTAPFALALLTGNTQHLSDETRREYSRTGTAHVLAVSGLHLAVIAAILLVPLGFIRQRWLKCWFFVVGISAFVVVTGASASAVRSGVMATLIFLVITLERETVLLNTLAFSVVVVLLVQPNTLFAIGFQMSVAAIIGIALVLPLCEHLINVWVSTTPALKGFQENAFTQAIATSLSLTLAASCAVAPIVAWYFGTFSVIAPLANLAVVPLSSAAMVYTMASVGASLVWWNGAEYLAQTAHQCLWWMNEINCTAAAFQYSALEGRWAFVAACTLSLLLVYVCASASRRQSIFRLGVSIGVALGVMMIAGEFAQKPEIALHIYPRKHIVAAHVQHGRVLTILLQDRRLPQNRRVIPQPDVGFERFVAEYCLPETDMLQLCVTGPASMLVASRIALQQNAQSQSNQSNKNIHILATTLAHKGQRWFQALDSVQAHGIMLVNAQEYLQRDSSIVLLDGRDSVRFVWNAWQSTIDVERRTSTGVIKKAGIILPQERCERVMFVR